jgi:hypothetical protein
VLFKLGPISIPGAGLATQPGFLTRPEVAFPMKRFLLLVGIAACCSPMTLVAQFSSSIENLAPLAAVASGAGGGGTAASGNAPTAPFSRLALGAGISPLGVNLSATTYVNRYLNVRGTGNIFSYSIDNISTNGLNISGNLNLASAGVSADFYPFPNHGFRLSPGLLFYNANEVTGTVEEQSGSSFTFNGTSYTSTSTVTGTAKIGLNSQNPAFTITTGWGNQISRKGGHLSFPVEIGVAVVGSPSVNIALTSGQVCATSTSGTVCQSVLNFPGLQSNIQAQEAKYKSDLDPLKTYPILSFGVAYSFGLR